jgi:glycosyltransferase involved in cell wall biosynthesis
VKIAMFGHKRIPSREGGVEIVVEELAARMAALGHSVTCYNRGGHHVSGREFDGEKRREYRGIVLKTVPTLDKKGLAAVTSSFFAAVCAAFSDAQVVHIHAEGPALFSWIPRLTGKRVVVTVHGLNWQCQKWERSLGATIIKLGERCAVRFAHKIIVLNRNTECYFSDTYKRNTCYIPNGITRPTQLPLDLIGQKYELNSNEYILFLGRIVPEKGVHYLIKAFAEVKTEKKLVISGGSSDSQEYIASLKQMAEKDSRIIFTGFVQGQVLEELYSNAYIYVLPSDTEGMPLSLLEAMSYGNCCVTSDIPGCREIAEDRALCFPAGDIYALRDMVQKLCDQPETVERFRRHACDQVCDRFSWEDVVRKTLEVYQ